MWDLQTRCPLDKTIPKSISNAMTKARISRNAFPRMSDSHDQNEPFTSSPFNIPESSDLQELASYTMEGGQIIPTIYAPWKSEMLPVNKLNTDFRTTGVMRAIMKIEHRGITHTTTDKIRTDGKRHIRTQFPPDLNLPSPSKDPSSV